ncbi:MAG: respiratory nitrate reductase subunit gamma [Acidimicrobiia bacterium]|nr:respiratory nitrate reductase subunit gamma [Acidimicrobiia bacterium]
MNWNMLLFIVFPYVAIVLAIVGTVYRMIRRPFTVSSLSSQLLEGRQLFWGSVPFHWGIVVILAAHLVALILPAGIEVWNRVPIRLYLLEITGLALALWALFGLGMLIYRRVSVSKIRAVTTPLDLVVLGLLLAQVITGILVATVYRFGSYWGTGVFVPYVQSLFTLQPRPELIAPLPFILQFHASLFFVFLVVFPFSRLVHIITVPLGYLTRPFQLVKWVRRDRPVSSEREPVGAGRR